ncbi:MAG: translation elongation factor Ts [Acidiferrobacterales bacterium]
MTISAAEVKALREMTGLGMMDCKKALQEAGGDMDAAVDFLRKTAGTKVEKKAGRTAAEGLVRIVTEDNSTALAEVNSETDFVAKGDEFKDFVVQVASCVARNQPSDISALMDLSMESGATVAKTLEAMVQKLGENMNVRRFETYSGDNIVGSYVHTTGKIAVMVELEGGDEVLAKDIAMHIAASRPQFVSADEVPEEVKIRERKFFTEQAKESGKPDNIIEKMVEGRIGKFLGEICLLGQPFVKDPDTKIEKLLQSAGARVLRFMRYEVGEGMARKEEDFAAEVMAQVKGA